MRLQHSHKLIACQNVQDGSGKSVSDCTISVLGTSDGAINLWWQANASAGCKTNGGQGEEVNMECQLCKVSLK